MKLVLTTKFCHGKAYPNTFLIIGNPFYCDSHFLAYATSWFGDEASDVCELFIFIEVSSIQFQLIIAELKKYCGNRNTTGAESILERILDNSKLKEKTKGLKSFLSSLRKFYVFAKQTSRDKILDSPDIINCIIHSKQSFIAKYWTKTRVEKEIKDGKDLNCNDLIIHLTRYNIENIMKQSWAQDQPKTTAMCQPL